MHGFIMGKFESDLGGVENACNIRYYFEHEIFFFTLKAQTSRGCVSLFLVFACLKFSFYVFCTTYQYHIP